MDDSNNSAAAKLLVRRKPIRKKITTMEFPYTNRKISTSAIMFFGLLLALYICTSAVSSLCIWERGNDGTKLACGFRKSGLFRLRNFGGVKSWAGLGFSVGDENGFKESITNIEKGNKPGQTGIKGGVRRSTNNDRGTTGSNSNMGQIQKGVHFLNEDENSDEIPEDDDKRKRRYGVYEEVFTNPSSSPIAAAATPSTGGVGGRSLSLVSATASLIAEQKATAAAGKSQDSSFERRNLDTTRTGRSNTNSNSNNNNNANTIPTNEAVAALNGTLTTKTDTTDNKNIKKMVVSVNIPAFEPMPELQLDSVKVSSSESDTVEKYISANINNNTQQHQQEEEQQPKVDLKAIYKKTKKANNNSKKKPFRIQLIENTEQIVDGYKTSSTGSSSLLQPTPKSEEIVFKQRQLRQQEKLKLSEALLRLHGTSSNDRTGKNSQIRRLDRGTEDADVSEEFIGFDGNTNKDRQRINKRPSSISAKDLKRFYATFPNFRHLTKSQVEQHLINLQRKSPFLRGEGMKNRNSNVNENGPRQNANYPRQNENGQRQNENYPRQKENDPRQNENYPRQNENGHRQGNFHPGRRHHPQRPAPPPPQHQKFQSRDKPRMPPPPPPFSKEQQGPPPTAANSRNFQTRPNGPPPSPNSIRLPLSLLRKYIPKTVIWPARPPQGKQKPRPSQLPPPRPTYKQHMSHPSRHPLNQQNPNPWSQRENEPNHSGSINHQHKMQIHQHLSSSGEKVRLPIPGSPEIVILPMPLPPHMSAVAQEHEHHHQLQQQQQHQSSGNQHRRPESSSSGNQHRRPESSASGPTPTSPNFAQVLPSHLPSPTSIYNVSYHQHQQQMKNNFQEKETILHALKTLSKAKAEVIKEIVNDGSLPQGIINVVSNGKNGTKTGELIQNNTTHMDIVQQQQHQQQQWRQPSVGPPQEQDPNYGRLPSTNPNPAEEQYRLPPSQYVPLPPLPPPISASAEEVYVHPEDVEISASIPSGYHYSQSVEHIPHQQQLIPNSPAITTVFDDYSSTEDKITEKFNTISTKLAELPDNEEFITLPIDDVLSMLLATTTAAAGASGGSGGSTGTTGLSSSSKSVEGTSKEATLARIFGTKHLTALQQQEEIQQIRQTELGKILYDMGIIHRIAAGNLTIPQMEIVNKLIDLNQNEHKFAGDEDPMATDGENSFSDDDYYYSDEGIIPAAPGPASTMATGMATAASKRFPVSVPKYIIPSTTTMHPTTTTMRTTTPQVVVPEPPPTTPSWRPLIKATNIPLINYLSRTANNKPPSSHSPSSHSHSHSSSSSSYSYQTKSNNERLRPILPDIVEEKVRAALKEYQSKQNNNNNQFSRRSGQLNSRKVVQYEQQRKSAVGAAPTREIPIRLSEFKADPDGIARRRIASATRTRLTDDEQEMIQLNQRSESRRKKPAQQKDQHHQQDIVIIRPTTKSKPTSKSPPPKRRQQKYEPASSSALYNAPIASSSAPVYVDLDDLFSGGARESRSPGPSSTNDRNRTTGNSNTSSSKKNRSYSYSNNYSSQSFNRQGSYSRASPSKPKSRTSSSNPTMVNLDDLFK